jgi:hypothetical protein
MTVDEADGLSQEPFPIDIGEDLRTAGDGEPAPPADTWRSPHRAPCR